MSTNPGHYLLLRSLHFALEEIHDVPFVINLGADHFPAIVAQVIQERRPFAKGLGCENLVLPLLHWSYPPPFFLA